MHHKHNQDAFVKFKEKSITKNDKVTNDLTTGWYSKDDMVKVLHWSTSLVQTSKHNS